MYMCVCFLISFPFTMMNDEREGGRGRPKNNERSIICFHFQQVNRSSSRFVLNPSSAWGTMCSRRRSLPPSQSYESCFRRPRGHELNVNNKSFFFSGKIMHPRRVAAFPILRKIINAANLLLSRCLRNNTHPSIVQLSN